MKENNLDFLNEFETVENDHDFLNEFETIENKDLDENKTSLGKALLAGAGEGANLFGVPEKILTIPTMMGVSKIAEKVGEYTEPGAKDASKTLFDIQKRIEEKAIESMKRGESEKSQKLFKIANESPASLSLLDQYKRERDTLNEAKEKIMNDRPVEYIGASIASGLPLFAGTSNIGRLPQLTNMLGKYGNLASKVLPTTEKFQEAAKLSNKAKQIKALIKANKIGEVALPKALTKITDLKSQAFKQLLGGGTTEGFKYGALTGGLEGLTSGILDEDKNVIKEPFRQGLVGGAFGGTLGAGVPMAARIGGALVPEKLVDLASDLYKYGKKGILPKQAVLEKTEQDTAKTFKRIIDDLKEKYGNKFDSLKPLEDKIGKFSIEDDLQTALKHIDENIKTPSERQKAINLVRTLKERMGVDVAEESALEKALLKQERMKLREPKAEAKANFESKAAIESLKEGNLPIETTEGVYNAKNLPPDMKIHPERKIGERVDVFPRMDEQTGEINEIFKKQYKDVSGRLFTPTETVETDVGRFVKFKDELSGKVFDVPIKEIGTLLTPAEKLTSNVTVNEAKMFVNELNDKSTELAKRLGSTEAENLPVEARKSATKLVLNIKDKIKNLLEQASEGNVDLNELNKAYSKFMNVTELLGIQDTTLGIDILKNKLKIANLFQGESPKELTRILDKFISNAAPQEVVKFREQLKLLDTLRRGVRRTEEAANTSSLRGIAGPIEGITGRLAGEAGLISSAIGEQIPVIPKIAKGLKGLAKVPFQLGASGLEAAEKISQKAINEPITKLFKLDNNKLTKMVDLLPQELNVHKSALVQAINSPGIKRNALLYGLSQRPELRKFFNNVLDQLLKSEPELNEGE